MGTSTFNPITRQRRAASAPTINTATFLPKVPSDYQERLTNAWTTEQALDTAQKILSGAPNPNVSLTTDVGQGGNTQTYSGGQPVNAQPGGTQGGDVWDGFARRYQQGTVDWRTMPGIVLNDYLNQNNQAGSRTRDNLGLEAAMGDWAANSPFIYNLLMSGKSGADIDSYTGDDDLINWMAQNFFPSMTTPGGRNPTTGQLMEMLFENGQNKDSLLYDMLFPTESGGGAGAAGGVDIEDQIDNIMGYMQTLARFSNPYMGSGIVSRANRLANDYRGQQAKGNFSDDNFLEYLSEEMGLRL